VLAIISYKQPITKSEIDAIRGIKSDRVIDGLVKKELIGVIGRSDKIGRPLIYGTTDEFLKQFGFENIKDLPEIEDLEDTLNEDKLEGPTELHEQLKMELQ
jgi:segregation and condensation protein B